MLFKTIFLLEVSESTTATDAATAFAVNQCYSCSDFIDFFVCYSVGFCKFGKNTCQVCKVKYGESKCKEVC